MHAYRKFVEDEMDRRGWKAVDLAKASGVSKQVLSNLLKDDRDRLRMLPGEQTVTGLARAFSVPESLILHRIGQAMGLPVGEPIHVADVSGVPNGELIRELATRLGEAGGERADGSAPMYQAGDEPAHDDQPDPTPPTSHADGRYTLDGELIDPDDHMLAARDDDDDDEAEAQQGEA